MSDFDVFGGTMKLDDIESHLVKLPEPNTLCIFMTRKEPARDSFNKAFTNVRYVVIDVDGEKYRYEADTLIKLLEMLEADDD